MAYPPAYDRTFSFTDWEVANPGQPKPGADLDSEFDAVSNALTATQTNLALIQRSDGALANDSVGEDQLQDGLFDAIGDAAVADAEAAAAAAAASASAAAGSATSASASASAAATSAGVASGEAASAGVSQGIAQAAADDAAASAAEAVISANEAETAANSVVNSVSEAQLHEEMAFKWAEYLAAPVMPAPPGWPEAVDDGMFSAKWWALRARDYNEVHEIDLGTAGTDIGNAFDIWDATHDLDDPPGLVYATWGTPPHTFALTDPSNPSDPDSWTDITGGPGPAGPPNTLTIGTVVTGTPSAATITGTAPNQVLNLTLEPGPTGGTGPIGPTGADGAAGPPNVLTIGTVVTGIPGSAAGASITGTSPAQVLNLTIPAGADGATGPPGPSAFANPSVPVGLAVVNGSSTNAMRADGAPALSQAIVPTWTGAHRFNALVNLAGPLQADGADGTAGQTLATQGAGLPPVWRSPGGGSVDLIFGFNTATTAADPGAQKFAFNNAAYVSVTAIYYDITSQTNFDATTILTLLTAGNRIYLQQRNDATRAAIYQVTGPATNMGGTGWFSVPVTVINSQGVMFASNADVTSVFMLSSSAGAAVANPTSTIGLTVVNGVAATAMRSDGAPPLDQAIAPLWSGIHNWGLTGTIQSTAQLGTRGRVNAFEFGHNNVAGFGSTLGYFRANGRPFLAFNAEHGTNDNTFRTRGIIGRVLQGDLLGGLLIGRAPTATADNQALTTDVTVAADGGMFMAAATGGSKGAGTINATGLYINNVAVAAGGTPGGATTQIQYNNAGAFAGDAGLVYTPATQSITVAGTEIWNNYSSSAPTTGGTVTMAAAKRLMILTPAGTLATLTVNLPASPVDGQVTSILTTQTITAITIAGQGGDTVATTVTSLPANTGVHFIKHAGVWRQWGGIVAAGAAAAGGSTTQVQYNSGGAFAGSANYTFDGTSIITLGPASGTGTIIGANLGSISIKGGPNGGGVILRGGDANGGGNIQIRPGDGLAAGNSGGPLIMSGGSGNGSGTGGDNTVSGGATQTGTAGNLLLNSGSVSSGSGGGYIALTTGTGNPQVERFRILANGAWSVGTAGTAVGTSGQVLTSTGATTPPTWQTPALAAANFANPTNNIGLTVVNGSLTTAMRSDAAPALSQAIVPTWTGAHTFNSTLNINSVGVAIRDVGYTTSGSLRWSIRVNGTAEGGSNAGSDFQIIRRNDAATALGNPWVTVTRATGSTSFSGANFAFDNQIQGPDGGPSAPSFSFATDPDTGMYRIGANNIGIASAGALALDIGPTVIGVYHVTTPTLSLLVAGVERAYFRYDNATTTARLDSDAILQLAANNAVGITLTAVASPAAQFNDGTNALPSITFLSDPDTGMYRSASDQIGFATAGTLRFSISVGALTSTIPLLLPDGTTANPSLSFSSDPNTGLYRPSGDFIGVTAGGTAIVGFLGPGATAVPRAWYQVPISLVDGAVATPSIFFETDQDTGIYRTTADSLGITTGGTLCCRFAGGTSPFMLVPQIYLNIDGGDGSVTFPAITWNSDQNTGIYRIAADTVGIAAGAVESARFTSTGVSSPSFTTTSSRAIKKVTGAPRRAADVLARLRPLLYRLLAGDDREQLGLIAEEVHEVCPQLSDGKTVSYDRLAILLLAAWQDEHVAEAA